VCCHRAEDVPDHERDLLNPATIRTLQVGCVVQQQGLHRGHSDDDYGVRGIQAGESGSDQTDLLR
jgi:hypothetical protein